MFRNSERVPRATHPASSSPGRLEEMIIYARLALQNVGGPGYDPYNSPAALGRPGSQTTPDAVTKPHAGN
jgi:hypothetical protein